MTPEKEIFTDSAASKLIGQTLLDGWTITEQLPRPGTAGGEGLSGSFFSIGYIVSKGQKKAFLKVIDVERALAERDGSTLMDRLKLIADSHTFECSILEVCTQASLDRIVSILAKGELPPPSGTSITLPYILFELADGDARKIVSKTNKIDHAWCFRVLHNIAVGLQQLHGQQIAHQDLKPSNVLIFDQGGKGAKIGDLGRASRKGREIYHDDLTIAGAVSYAPPEQVYGIRPERWEDRREGCDLYHLGSLATYLFSGITPTDYYRIALSQNIRPSIWNGNDECDYLTALPILTQAFTAFIETIRTDLPEWAEAELSLLIINACNPDYTKRGDPEARARVGSPIGIESFISKFDRMAKHAWIELRK